MNYEANMIIAINDQSSSISSLQVGQAQSADFVAEILESVYQQAEEAQKNILYVMDALNQFYSVVSLDRDNMAAYFDSFPGSSKDNDLAENAQTWCNDFNNACKSAGINVSIQHIGNGTDLHKNWDETDDWEITFSIDGQTYSDINGTSFVNDYQSYLSLAQTDYQQSQQEATNQEQGDQSILQDEEGGVQSTSEANSNLISTGSTITQAMGYTSSLLASSM